MHPVAGGRVAGRSEVPEVAHAVGQAVGELIGVADIEDRGIPVDPDLVVVLLDDRERAALGPFGVHEVRGIEDVTPAEHDARATCAPAQEFERRQQLAHQAVGGLVDQQEIGLEPECRIEKHVGPHRVQPLAVDGQGAGRVMLRIGFRRVREVVHQCGSGVTAAGIARPTWLT